MKYKTLDDIKKDYKQEFLKENTNIVAWIDFFYNLRKNKLDDLKIMNGIDLLLFSDNYKIKLEGSSLDCLEIINCPESKLVCEHVNAHYTQFIKPALLNKIAEEIKNIDEVLRYLYSIWSGDNSYIHNYIKAC